MSQVDYVVSEFEKFLDLELRDCIAGYDVALYQARSNKDTPLNIAETESILGYMIQALNNKNGQEFAMSEIRETSSFHVSGVYLGGGDGLEHLAYQEKIISSCNAQIGRIAKQAAERKGQQ